MDKPTYQVDVKLKNEFSPQDFTGKLKDLF